MWAIPGVPKNNTTLVRRTDTGGAPFVKVVDGYEFIGAGGTKNIVKRDPRFQFPVASARKRKKVCPASGATNQMRPQFFKTQTKGLEWGEQTGGTQPGATISQPTHTRKGTRKAIFQPQKQKQQLGGGLIDRRNQHEGETWGKKGKLSE